MKRKDTMPPTLQSDRENDNQSWNLGYVQGRLYGLVTNSSVSAFCPQKISLTTLEFQQLCMNTYAEQQYSPCLHIIWDRRIFFFSYTWICIVMGEEP